MKRYKCPRCNRKSNRPGRCVICPDAPEMELRKGIVAVQAMFYVAGAALVFCIVAFGVIPNLKREGPVVPADAKTTKSTNITGLFTLESNTTDSTETYTTQELQTEDNTTPEETDISTTNTPSISSSQQPHLSDQATTRKPVTTTKPPATTQKPTTTKSPATTTRVNIWLEPQNGSWYGNTLHIWVNADGTNRELGSFIVHIENTDNKSFEVDFSNNYAGRVMPLLGKLGGTVDIRGNGTFIASGDEKKVQVTVTSKADRSKTAICWVVVHKS